jgi:post-segregation antitoxin (ccd killing protein)
MAMQDAHTSSVMIEVGAGELIDKITILAIKRERIADPAKLRNVIHELEVLEAAQQRGLPASAELARLQAELREVNEVLWQVEDDIRDCEAGADFGPRFIELARSVYRLNDRRAALKKAINLHCGSSIVEEKSYAGSA